MKKDKVPQDDGNVFEGKIKPLKYAVDDAGNYTRVSSAGWEPEQIVLSQAWEDIHEKAELIREKVLEGKLSPLAYHMECKMLNPEMLGGYVGYSAFRVRLHLKPWFFRRLTHHQIEKYARALQITAADLTSV
jgi:hypothetical protein